MGREGDPPPHPSTTRLIEGREVNEDEIAEVVDRHLRAARLGIVTELASKRQRHLSDEGIAREMVDQKRAYSIADFSDAIGISQSVTHELLSSGQLKSFKIGRRRIIPREAIDEWIAEQMGR